MILSYKVSLPFIILSSLFAVGLSHADSQPYLALKAKYISIQPQMDKADYREPIVVQSLVKTDVAQGDVYARLDTRLHDLAELFISAEALCDVLILHLNVKACVVHTSDSKSMLDIYIGRKYYQAADSANKVTYHLSAHHSSSNYIAVSLSATEAPYGVSSLNIHLEAAELDDAHVFLHMSYGYGYTDLGKIALQGYFLTLGRNKVGFSHVGHNADGSPVYVKGMQGMVERNAMRYFLAIKAYLDTKSVDNPVGFKRRLERWFDLTQEHKRQLYELPKSEYISIKMREKGLE